MANIDNKGVSPKRIQLGDRLRAKYPDKDFSDDDTFYDQISSDYDSYDNELTGYKDREKAFSDMFTSDPRSADFITSWRKGEDPVVGLIRRFGDSIKDAIDDPDMQEQIAAANKEYVERMTKSRELEEEYQRNLSETLSTLEGLSEEGKIPDSEIDEAMEFLIGIVHDGIVGKFSPSTIELALKAMHHDSDVEDAERAGEVRGRNARIDEKLRRSKQGDGMPVLNGKNGQGGVRNKNRSIFDLAREAES